MAAQPKLLVVGLDALPWSVLKTMMDLGACPNLKRMMDAGASGDLRSTIPHLTPAAWTTFMTGVQPGTHGIVNWQRFDARRCVTTLNNAERLATKNIYHFLSEAGRRVGVVMQPQLFPPFPVNGFLLSGFDSPGLDAPFAFPRDLEKEILEICPEHARNLDPGIGWQTQGYWADDTTFAANVDALRARVRRVTSLAIELHRRHPVDVLMVYFQDPDNILHRAWQWVDPKSAQKDPERHRKVVEFFREMDQACGDLEAKVHGPEGLTLVLSDHGQHADRLRVRLNTILARLGFLVPATGLALARDAWRRMYDGIRGRRRKGVGIPIDWDRTRAYMAFEACTGFIYVNVKGRQPYGSVPASQYTSVRDEVIAALRAYRDPDTGENYFMEVGATDGLFRLKESLDLPDVYVQPAKGIEFVRRARLREVAYPTKRSYAGLHDIDGMYILSGPNVKRVAGLNAHIVDMAPTLLAALDQPVPEFMEGRVLAECFEQPPKPTVRPMAWDAATEAQNAYTSQQQDQVEKRLRDLGYLD